MRINHWTWAPLASVLLFSGCAGEGSSTTGDTGTLCTAEAGGGCSDGCEKDAVLGCIPVDGGVSTSDSNEPPVCDGKSCEPAPCECVGGMCIPGTGCTCEDVVCEPPPDCGCTLTQGFWKNHEGEWPVDGLTIGGTDYTAAELDAILDLPAEGDASIILAYQTIAALLNVDNGADCSEVEGLAEAQAWFAAYCTDIPCGIDPSSEIGAQAVSLGAWLDAFNNGIVGPGHCQSNVR